MRSYYFSGFRSGDKVRIIRNIKIKPEDWSDSTISKFGTIIESGTEGVIKKKSCFSIFNDVPNYHIICEIGLIHEVPAYLIEPIKSSEYLNTREPKIIQ